MASCSTSKYRIITVKNYDLYQSQGKQKGKPKGKQTAGREQTEGQAEGKQRATDNKYISNDIYKKEKKVSAALQGRADTVKKEPAVSGSPLEATASAPIKKAERKKINFYLSLSIDTY